MKKLILLLVLASIPGVVFFGCKHDPVLPDYQVSFSQEVMPVIQMGCQHSGCHGDSLNQEFKLVDYETVMGNGDVKPGNPEDSKLYEVLILPESSEDHMPRDRPSLSEKNIKLIYIWIAQGAKDN